jgi:hypothetical protein
VQQPDPQTPLPWKNVKVERALHQRLKSQAAIEERTVMAIVNDLVVGYLDEKDSARAKSA